MSQLPAFRVHCFGSWKLHLTTPSTISAPPRPIFHVTLHALKIMANPYRCYWSILLPLDSRTGLGLRRHMYRGRLRRGWSDGLGHGLLPCRLFVWFGRRSLDPRHSSNCGRKMYKIVGSKPEKGEKPVHGCRSILLKRCWHTWALFIPICQLHLYPAFPPSVL